MLFTRHHSHHWINSHCVWMNNQIAHEAVVVVVVVVKKTEKCKSELTTSSDSDTHAENKKIAGLVKIVKSIKNRKKTD